MRRGGRPTQKTQGKCPVLYFFSQHYYADYNYTVIIHVASLMNSRGKILEKDKRKPGKKRIELKIMFLRCSNNSLSLLEFLITYGKYNEEKLMLKNWLSNLYGNRRFG